MIDKFAQRKHLIVNLIPEYEQRIKSVKWGEHESLDIVA